MSFSYKYFGTTSALPTPPVFWVVLPYKVAIVPRNFHPSVRDVYVILPLISAHKCDRLGRATYCPNSNYCLSTHRVRFPLHITYGEYISLVSNTY